MRIGQGFDAHRLVEGRKLVIGAVEIPFERGILGHSDGDVLCHAVADAILGAAALGDLGKYFPDSDRRWKDASSIQLLRNCVEMIQNAGLTVANVDSTIILERPKLAAHIDEMRKNLAAALDLPPSAVSVKAKTTEGLGFTGDGSGVVAHAVAMLQ